MSLDTVESLALQLYTRDDEYGISFSTIKKIVLNKLFGNDYLNNYLKQLTKNRLHMLIDYLVDYSDIDKHDVFEFTHTVDLNDFQEQFNIVAKRYNVLLTCNNHLDFYRLLTIEELKKL